MFETVANPTFTAADLSSRNKRPGISAFVRLKNEQDFGADSIKSILPFFDEIVITYNDCTDATPDIVADLERAYPDRIKAYRYLPVVVPPGSDLHRSTPAASPQSLTFYYNFAMSKVSYQIRCKWDGDQIAEPRAFGKVIQRLRELKRGSLAWWFSPWRFGYWRYQGLNLWDDHGTLFVPVKRPILGRRGDHGFWGASRLYRFKKDATCEYLFTRLMHHTDVGCIFYHLKGMKRDRGISVYQLEKHPESTVKRIAERSWLEPTLMPLADYQAQVPIACRLPDPETVGIRPRFVRGTALPGHLTETRSNPPIEPAR